MSKFTKIQHTHTSHMSSYVYRICQTNATKNFTLLEKLSQRMKKIDPVEGIAKLALERKFDDRKADSVFRK